MARKRYLKKTPLTEARELFLEAVAGIRLEDETVDVGQALHRITAEPVFARISSPHYHGSAMDGICVRAEDTFGATEFSPRRLQLLADEAHAEGCFAYLDTGQPLPAWADAVIMIEKVRDAGEGAVSIDEAATPWQNVRLVGEDVVATELLLPRNHRLRPYDLGAVLAAGHTILRVKARPRVAIIPTGDEITAPGEGARPGEIIDFNSPVLAAMVAECGGAAETLTAVPDDPALLKRALVDAVEGYHLVALIAGSSAGEHDFTAEVIDGAGRLLVHGIDVMPGKPAVLGVVGGKPVIGIPGYPVSAIVIAREILQPALQEMLGAGTAPAARIRAMAPRKIPSRLGLEEFVRVTLGRVEDRLMAVPLARGAGVITTMVRADGFLRIPGTVEGINAGEEVDIELLRSPEEVERTVLCTGSHDLSISVLEDQLKRRDPRLKVATANVGSLGGLHSIRRGETHMAGTHLLDPATGDYNVPDIRRVLPDVPVVLVHCVRRSQGLLAPRGNPMGLSGVGDLGRGDLRFVNRQPGSGTRVLLDYQLGRLGIDAGTIQGYDHEEFTHMAVAVAVASGLADTGLGIRSAADALGLDFIPVGDEQYDLLLLRSFYESPTGATLLEVLRSEEFKLAMQSLGGYDTGATGEVLYEQG